MEIYKIGEKSAAELADEFLESVYPDIRQRLQTLQELELKIFRVHFEHHGEELAILHKTFSNARTIIEDHLIRQEAQLFRAIYSIETSDSKNLREKTAALIMESAERELCIGKAMKALFRHSNGFAIPDGVCPTYEKTIKGFQELSKKLEQMAALERVLIINI